MSRFLNLFRKRRLDRQMDEEFAFHLDQLREEFIRRGLPPADAEREARRQFGNAQSISEACRDQRGLPWLSDLAADLRHAARLLARSPGFASIAILTLALAIGANTAIFSLVNGVYLRRAPYPNAPRLVDIVRETRRGAGVAAHNSRRFLYWKERARSFSEVAAMAGGGSLNLIGNGEAEQVRAARVSENFFRALGVAPAIGRPFTPQEDSPNGPDAIILSWGLWQRRFGGDPQILSRTINLGGKLSAVVGVMPRDVAWVRPVDVWTPLRARPVNDGRNTWVFGLLRPGVTERQASAEVGELIVQYQHDFPGEAREFVEGERAAVAPFNSGSRESGFPLLILLGAVGLILLIACANLGNLLLARATGRIREVAIRATLGAGRSRIVRQLLAESMLIALCGAAAGLALAMALRPGLLAISPITLPDWQQVALDWRVLAFTAAAAIATGLLFGLLPAIQASRLDLNEAMKESGLRATSGRGTGRLRSLIVGAEIALSFMLLIGAGLLLRTFSNLLSVRTGVDSTNVVTGQMPLKGQRYETTAATVKLVRQGLERLRALPGVESAAFCSNLPMERGLNLVTWVPGTADEDGPKLTDWRAVTSGYFPLMRIGLVAGRLFTEADGSASEPVVVINQEFARRYFGAANPVGRSMHIMKGSSEPDRPRVVVGIVADVKSENFRAAAPPTVFVPLEQAPDAHLATANHFFQANWVVRTRSSGAGLAAAMQRELRAVDPLQPFSGFRTLEEIRASAIRQDRSMTILLSAFAVVALLLAAMGIYGVIAYSVAQRAHEIGIRLALGATPAAVVRRVVGGATVLALVGIAAGAAGAFGLTRFLARFIYGVQADDPATFAGAGVLLMAVALTASVIPALRVTRLDPARALRVE